MRHRCNHFSLNHPPEKPPIFQRKSVHFPQVCDPTVFPPSVLNHQQLLLNNIIGQDASFVLQVSYVHWFLQFRYLSFSPDLILSSTHIHVMCLVVVELGVFFCLTRS
jgi:hypothetical protein